MKIDGVKFTEAIKQSGIGIQKLVAVSGLDKSRIYQLKRNGGNTNDLSAKALAKVLKVSIDDIKGE